MKKTRLIPVLSIAIVVGTISLVFVRRNHSPSAQFRPIGVESLPAASTVPQQGTTSVTGPAATGGPKGFRVLPVLERQAILSDIRRRTLREIFELWQHAGTVEKDLMKQGAIATTMAYALREQSPSRDLLDDMWHYVVDPRNSSRERAGVLGIFGGAKTTESMEFLIMASKDLVDPQLRRIALGQISDAGDLRGDGSYHEERSIPAEKVWKGSADPDLLSRTASAIAKIGAPSGINLLLDSALDADPANAERRQAALSGLEQVYSRNATAPVAALLARHPGENEASNLAIRILVNIGDEAAGNVLVRWFQNADASAANLATNAVARTRTPALLEAWKKSLGERQSFRSDEIYAVIREALERYNKSISIER